jgi:Glycosyl hydrolases family 28
VSLRGLATAAVGLALFAATGPAFAKTCDITEHGARAGDEELDTAAITAAIAACAPHGGRVLVPAGVFRAAGVELKSGIEFHLAGGAVLKGASDLAAYPRPATGDTGRSRGLLVGIGVRDVLISGTGMLDGAGTPFHKTPDDRPDFTLGLFDCQGVRVRDVTIVDPATYHVTLNRCQDVVVDGVTILADALAPNSDGIQVRDTSDVRISNCRIETGDDAIVLKSAARMVERVSITNCVIASDDAAIKFGTGSEPGIRYVNVRGVTVTRSRYGVALFMQDGGIYEHNRFADMVIATGGRHAREYPIFVDIDTRQTGDAGGWGRIRGLTFDGIDVVTRGTILIQGQPGHDVEDLALSDITMRVENAVDPAKVNGKPRGNRLHAARTGASDLSSVAGHVVIGHARAVTISNLRAAGATDSDRRPAIVLRDVKDLAADAALLGETPR